MSFHCFGTQAILEVKHGVGAETKDRMDRTGAGVDRCNEETVLDYQRH